ncbi:MAG: PTS sugar transporter subunit IIC [Erysipelotrichaceae bacterium]|nr:PTS sugar transporter subunit IIC [Erysipelotrichaceae bacterium]
MQFILNFFSTLNSLGAVVVMPFIIAIMGVIMGTGVGKAIRAGLTVGVGFIGLNLVTGLMGTYLAPAVVTMCERFGLHLNVIDVGWPAAAAIAFGTQVGSYIIPVCLLVNIVMILTGTTQTIDVDIWDYWHFAFTGSLVAIATNSIAYGLLAAVFNMVIIMVLGDLTAKDVEDSLGLPGVSLPHGFSTAYAPIAMALNWLLDKIPGVNKIFFDLEKLQDKIGVFGEPILVGTVIGLIIGVAAGLPYNQVLTLAINMGACLVLIPKMAALLMEGLIPISDAASGFIEKHFSGHGQMYIGLDSAVGVGHPLTLSVALLLVPISVLLAVALPGNQFMPFADLAVIPWMFVLITPVVKGNGFRALVIGVVVLIAAFYIGTDLAPSITIAAEQAKFDFTAGTQISSICDGGNPLTWAIYKLNTISPIVGIAVVGAIAIALAVFNRARIKKVNAAAAAEEA